MTDYFFPDLNPKIVWWENNKIGTHQEHSQKIYNTSLQSSEQQRDAEEGLKLQIKLQNRDATAVGSPQLDARCPPSQLYHSLPSWTEEGK